MKNRSTQIEFDFYIPPDSTNTIDANTGAVSYSRMYLLSDYVTRAIMSSSGYGMPEIKYIEQTGPFQHGNTLLDYRLLPRTIDMELRQSSPNRRDYWSDRASFIEMFRINKQPIAGALYTGKLMKIQPDGTKRCIDVLFSGGVNYEFESGTYDEFGSFNNISFIASDPTFYEPVLNTEVVVLSATTELAFPKQIEGWAYCTANVLIGDTTIPYKFYGTPNASASRLTATTTPIAAGDILIIDNEKLVVTAVTITDSNTGTVTVTRGYGGTSAAAHSLDGLIAVIKDTTTVANFGITSTTFEPWRIVFDFPTTLTTEITAVSTTIDYTAILTTNSAAAVGDVLFCQTVSGGSLNNEKMLVTGVISSTSVTVTRGYGGTTAIAHSVGDKLVITTAAQIALNANSLGITLGSATLSEGFVINYLGTWNSFPTIDVTGPWDNFTITNSATLETLDLGYNIGSGETVTFNLGYGVKSVINQNGTNLIGSLATDSDLATFHLTPDAEITTGLADGINPMSVSGNNLDANSNLVVSWFTRYIGI